MNLVLLFDRDFIDTDLVELKGRRFRHLQSVTGIEEGKSLACGKLNGRMGTGIVTGIVTGTGKDLCQIKVSLDLAPPDPLPLKLVLALPRPKMFRRIIQTVTTLGVKEIHLINSWRVEKSFWKSPAIEPESIHEQMILGLEQSKDTMLPRVCFHRFFKEFVENRLPDISRNTLCMVAHPRSGQSCPAGVNQQVTLVVGPEGGFIDIEIETLEKIGFSSYHMGPRILKVEPAVTCLISRLFN